MFSGKERNADLRLCFFQVPGQGRLGQIKALCGAGQTLFLNNADQVFQYLGIEIYRTRSGRRRSTCGERRDRGTARRGICQQGSDLRRRQRLVTRIRQAFPDQQRSEKAFGFAEGVTQRITQMQCLVGGRDQGQIGQLFAGIRIDTAYKPGAGALLHHSVQKMDIAGFKDDDREISGFGKQRVSAMPQAVFGALEDKGSIAQLGEAYGVFPGERMRTRKHSKHFFPWQREGL